VADAGAIGVNSSTAGKALTISASIFDRFNYGEKSKTIAAAKFESFIEKFYKRKLPQYLEAGPNPVSVTLTGDFSGVVSEEGVPVEGRYVYLYYRKTGILVDFKITDSNGAFAFSDLYDDGLFYAVALDDLNSSPNFNAQILDQLVPG
jgi:hypothetical protein